MARITVEDCLKQIPNRFDLVLLATKRAKQLLDGRVEPIVSWENDKATVVALREIASGKLTEEMLKIADSTEPLLGHTGGELSRDDG